MARSSPCIVPHRPHCISNTVPRYLKHLCDRICLFTAFHMEGGCVWSVRHARFRWCGWFSGLRAELHCNHNYKEEGGERSLDRCESEESSRTAKSNSPTDLRMLSHFTSSISDRRSYKVTRDLFSKAYKAGTYGTLILGTQASPFTTHLDLNVDFLACTLLFISPTVDIHLDPV